jgi:hypothetical protein
LKALLQDEQGASTVEFAIGNGAWVLPTVHHQGIAKSQEGERDSEVYVRLSSPTFASWFGDLTYEKTSRCRLERFHSC